MNTTRVRRLGAATAGVALAAGLTTGCGTSTSERQAGAVAASADAVVEAAQTYVGDPWERRAIAEHQRVPRHVQLAMDRALAQRLVREHTERLAELRTRCR